MKKKTPDHSAASGGRRSPAGRVGRVPRLIRDALIRNPVMAPDAFASRVFTEGFDPPPKERRNPGHYANGIHIASPPIFGAANEQAQWLREVCRERCGDAPDWVAACAFDSGPMPVEAIGAAAAADMAPERPAEARRWIRDCLADPDRAAPGVTGFNHLDENGDAIKPIALGVFRRRNIISALAQVRPVYKIQRIPRFQEAARDRRILLSNGRSMYKANVVRNGVSVNKIGNLHFRDLTFELDANLWFRHQDKPDVTDIEFLNAAESISLGPPLDEREHEGIASQLCRARGRFRMDFVQHRRGRRKLFRGDGVARRRAPNGHHHFHRPSVALRAGEGRPRAGAGEGGGNFQEAERGSGRAEAGAGAPPPSGPGAGPAAGAEAAFPKPVRPHSAVFGLK